MIPLRLELRTACVLDRSDNQLHHRTSWCVKCCQKPILPYSWDRAAQTAIPSYPIGVTACLLFLMMRKSMWDVGDWVTCAIDISSCVWAEKKVRWKISFDSLLYSTNLRRLSTQVYHSTTFCTLSPTTSDRYQQPISQEEVYLNKIVSSQSQKRLLWQKCSEEK
jgi:hypothetical protein